MGEYYGADYNNNIQNSNIKMSTMKMKIPITTMILAMSCSSVTGFSPVSSNINRGASVSKISTLSTSTSRLYAGGFGGGGGMGGDKKQKKAKTVKETKLKPKQQWDRYGEFKREPKIQVAVRVKEDESDEWLEVGRVKSKDSKHTEAAVFRQRAIIADVRNND